jgi:hypothetical protein
MDSRRVPCESLTKTASRRIVIMVRDCRLELRQQKRSLTWIVPSIHFVIDATELRLSDAL